MLNVVINRKKLEAGLHGILPGGALYVLDANGQLLCSAGDTQTFHLPVGIDTLMSGEELKRNALGDGITVISQHSANTMWQYYLLATDDTLASKSMQSSQWMQWLVVVCVFIGVACAAVFSFLNYRPIGKLRDEVLSYQPADHASSVGNELDLIRDNLRKTYLDNAQLARAQEQVLQKYEHLRRFSSRNQRLLMDGLIMRLARGQVDDWEATRAWMSAANVRLDAKNFMIAMIHMSEQSESATSMAENDETALMIFVVRSVTDEMIATIGHCYSVVTLKNALLLLINTDADEMTVIGVLQAIQDFLSTKAGILASIGVGCMQTEMETLNISYSQAEQALDYRFVAGKGRVIRYMDIQTGTGGVIRLSEERLRQMSAAVLRHDTAHLDRMLDKTYQELVNLGQMSMLQAQSLYYDIIHMVMRTLDGVNADVADIFGVDYDPLAELGACEMISEVFDVLRNILMRVSKYNPENGGRSAQLVDAAIAFIEKEVYRPDFNQTMVAEAVGVSPAYLSRLIKNMLHENMVDICNRLRVEKASEYLLTTDMPLQEVAQNVGLTTVKSLIRIFKQYTGATPGTIRKNKCGGENPQDTREEKE